MVRFYANSAESPSKYVSIFAPSHGGNYVRVLNKRYSVAPSSATSVGLVQDSFEPDVVEGYQDVSIFNIDSVNNSGAWTTDLSVLPGVYTRTANTVGAARTFSFDGDPFRFQDVQKAGTAALDMAVDGIAIGQIAAGTGSARRRVTARSGFGPGPHTLKVTHAGTGGQPVYISGINVSDADGMSTGPTNYISGVRQDGYEYLAGGVQTMSILPPDARRMGGGHGGDVGTSDPIAEIDGVSYNINSFAASTYMCGTVVKIIETFDLEQPIDQADPTGPRYVFASVRREMTFRAGGYSCRIIPVITNGMSGRQVISFFYAQLPLSAHLTEIRHPVFKPVADAPIPLTGQWFDYRNPITGRGVVLFPDGKFQSPDAVPAAVLVLNAPTYKHYTTGAYSDPKTFVGEQDLSYSIEFVHGTIPTFTSNITPPTEVTGASTSPGATSITLAWTSPDDANYASSRIYRSATNSLSEATLVETIFGVRAENNTWVDSAVLAGQYFYWIKSANSDGVESDGVALNATLTWGPSSLGAKLKAWWTPNDVSTITKDGSGLVSAWVDKVAGYSISQAAGSKQPIYSATGYNGSPGVTFDGVDDVLFAASQPFPSGATPCEMWAVASQDASGSGSRTLFAYGSGVSTARRSIRRNFTSSTSRLAAVVGSTSITQSTTAYDGRHTARVRIGATASAISLDGGAETTASVVPATGATRIAMGATEAVTAAEFWQGTVRHIIVTTDGLTTEESNRLLRWCDWQRAA